MLNLANAEGFIFDCDGTLLDTLDAWDAAEAELFSQAGELTQEQEDEIHSAPIEQAAAILHEKYGVGESADAVLAHLDAHLLPFYGERAEALPGVVEFVRKVADAGVPCVVLSSSPRRYLEAGLARIGVLIVSANSSPPTRRVARSRISRFTSVRSTSWDHRAKPPGPSTTPRTHLP